MVELQNKNNVVLRLLLVVFLSDRATTMEKKLKIFNQMWTIRMRFFTQQHVKILIKLLERKPKWNTNHKILLIDWQRKPVQIHQTKNPQLLISWENQKTGRSNWWRSCTKVWMTDLKTDGLLKQFVLKMDSGHLPKQLYFIFLKKWNFYLKRNYEWMKFTNELCIYRHKLKLCLFYLKRDSPRHFYS